MPVILGDKEAVDTWLTDSSAANFKMVLKPYEDSDLVWYPVTPAMGKPSFDGPECIKEMENKSSISKFFSRKETNWRKREQEELVTDSKLNTDENENSQLSPLRKKANLKDGSDKQPTRVLSQAKKSKRKGVDDKQPTLLSFFSKK